MNCPHCSTDSSDKLKVIGRRMTYPVPSLFQLGGLFFAICFAESRRRIHLCTDCGKTTDKHTFLSVCFFFLFVIQLILIGVTLISWLVMMLFFILFY